MNLTKDPKNPERLKSDLDQIQRDFGVLNGLVTTLQQQVATLQTQVNTQLNPPIIAPNGHVTTFKNLNGTPRQSGGGLVIAPDGSLSGDGTPSFPLDGVIRYVTVPTSAVSSWLFGLSTTPKTLVPGVAGLTHVPIYCSIYSKIVGNGGSYTNGAATFNLHYIPGAFGTLPWGNFGGLNLSLNTAIVSPNIARAYLHDFQSSLNTNNVTNATFTAVGKPLLLQTSADISGGSNAVAGLTLIYIDIPDNVY